MMNRDTFEDVMKDAADEFGWWFMPMDDSWELWNEICAKPHDYPRIPTRGRRGYIIDGYTRTINMAYRTSREGL